MGYKNKYEPNGTEEEVKIGILHNVNGYWVSNEGTQQQPSYHVWIPSIRARYAIVHIQK